MEGFHLEFKAVKFGSSKHIGDGHSINIFTNHSVLRPFTFKIVTPTFSEGVPMVANLIDTHRHWNMEKV